MSQILIQVGNKIQKIRKNKGLTQTELATKIGLSRVAYFNIEYGNHNTSLENYERIAHSLGVTLPFLFSDDESRTIGIEEYHSLSEQYHQLLKTHRRLVKKINGALSEI